MLSINHITCHIPKAINITTDYHQIGISKLHARIYYDFYGLEKIPYANHKSLATLLRTTLKKFFEEVIVDKNTISYLIYAHTITGICPHGSQLLLTLLNEFELKTTKAFSISMNKCASGLTALEISDALFKNEPRNKKILILTGDLAFSPALRTLQNATITGDAATVSLLGQQGNNSLIALEKQTYGEFSQGDWGNAVKTLKFENDFVLMAKTIIEKVLQKANLQLTDITCFLPHNVNIPIWEQIASSLNIPFSKIYYRNIKRTAHCFASDFFINYKSLAEEKLLSAQSYYLAMNVGFGLTFSAAIIQFTNQEI